MLLSPVSMCASSHSVLALHKMPSSMCMRDQCAGHSAHPAVRSHLRQRDFPKFLTCHAQVEWSTTSGGPYTESAVGMTRAYIQVQCLSPNIMQYAVHGQHAQRPSCPCTAYCMIVKACACKPHLLCICMSFKPGHRALCVPELFLYVHARLPADLMKP